MKKFLSVALIAALLTASLSSCTIHLSKKDKDNDDTSSYVIDYDWSSDDESSEDEDEVSSSYGVKMDESDVEFKESTEDAPLKMGDWAKVMINTGSEPDYVEVGVCAEELFFGEEAEEIIIENGFTKEQLDEAIKDGNEWALLKYKVYYPEDVVVEDRGLRYNYLNVMPTYISGNYKYTCFTTDITHYDNYDARFIQPGEMGEGMCLFSVGKDMKELSLKIGDDPDLSNSVEEGRAWYVFNR